MSDKSLTPTPPSSRPSTRPSTEPAPKLAPKSESSDYDTENTEKKNDYSPGGLHPTKLGDTLDVGRYSIIRKLGYGCFSTVWFARDGQASRYVAIKVCRADTSSPSNELRIYQQLEADAATDYHSTRVNASHVVQMLEHFRLNGPNGIHQCLVFEPMAATMNTIIEAIRDYSTLEGRSYPLQLLKSIIKQILLGLEFLHSHNVVHGDLQPGNLLFAAKDLNEVAEEHLIQRVEKGKTVRQMSKQDGERNQCVPKYIFFTEKLSQYVDISGPRTLVKLSDLGACNFATTACFVLDADSPLAFNSSDPPEKVQTPVALRAPELVLGAAFDHGIDIWSFGCLMYEFFTQQPLFSVWQSTWLPQYRTNDSHLLQMIDALGPLPDSLFNLWERGGRYFGPDGKVIRTDVGEEKPCPYPIYIGPPLEEMFA